MASLVSVPPMGNQDSPVKGLSDAARRELLAEQQRLRADRERIMAELRRVEELLAPIDVLVGNGTKSTKTTPQRPLREAILGILREKAEGLRPIEATKALEALGYHSEGSTAFQTLVSNQLWRMANKENVLSRSDKTGKYSVLRS